MRNNNSTPPSLDRELKRGVLDLVLLAILTEGPQYGYSIVTTITERTKGLLEIKDGTLYPVLYRLEAAGFVEAYWQAPDAPQGRSMPRKYYRLTAAGRSQYGTLAAQWQTFVLAIGYIVDTPALGSRL